MIADSGFDIDRIRSQARGVLISISTSARLIEKIYPYLRNLQRSLRNPESSFLAARYVNQLGCRLSTGKARPKPFDIAKWLCGHYLDGAVKRPSVIEWSILDKLLSIGSVMELTALWQDLYLIFSARYKICRKSYKGSLP